MSLNGPPWWSHLLLESPIPLVVALVLLGLIVAWHGMRRLNRRVTWAGLAMFLLAGAVWGLASLVETTREQLIERTGLLVAHTAPLDTPGLKAFFTPGATLSGPRGNTWLPFDRVFQVLDSTSRRFNITGNALDGIDAEGRGAGEGLSEFGVRTLIGSEYGDRPVHTHWRIRWQKGGDGVWRVADVQWLRYENAEPSPALLW
ncbi:MAG: hypothetical protein K8S99_18260 [Planctomycetes bacterium]|nr:hypothetical protein [Planctomycetota bacterium]